MTRRTHGIIGMATLGGTVRMTPPPASLLYKKAATVGTGEAQVKAPPPPHGLTLPRGDSEGERRAAGEALRSGLGNVMAQQRQQRGRGSGGGGVFRLVAGLLLALALLSLCLARADAAAPSASASLGGAAPASDSEHGVATALENALAQEVALGHATPSTAVAEEDEGDGDVVLERVAMESTEDYGFPSANSRHVPHP